MCGLRQITCLLWTLFFTSLIGNNNTTYHLVRCGQKEIQHSKSSSNSTIMMGHMNWHEISPCCPTPVHCSVPGGSRCSDCWRHQIHFYWALGPGNQSISQNSIPAWDGYGVFLHSTSWLGANGAVTLSQPLYWASRRWACNYSSRDHLSTEPKKEVGKFEWEWKYLQCENCYPMEGSYTERRVRLRIEHLSLCLWTRHSTSLNRVFRTRGSLWHWCPWNGWEGNEGCTIQCALDE